jgi:RNA polymerase sigma-70 factor (ECF subfamily)
MMETAELVQRAVEGDEDALAKLLAAHGPRIKQTLTIERKWRSVLEPADVMQVTYLEAFLQIHDFDPNRPEPFLEWLRRIAENNLRDAIRGLQRQKRPQPADRISGDGSCDLLAILGVVTTTPVRQAVRDERQSKLETMLDALPEDYGQVVRLYDLQGLPIAEVASRMRRSAGAVHMLRARAHDRLRGMMGSESAWFTSSA